MKFPISISSSRSPIAALALAVTMTTLLRDNVVRYSVGLFVPTLVEIATDTRIASPD